MYKLLTVQAQCTESTECQQHGLVPGPVGLCVVNTGWLYSYDRTLATPSLQSRQPTFSTFLISSMLCCVLFDQNWLKKFRWCFNKNSNWLKQISWWLGGVLSLPPSSKYENKYQRKQETPVISGLVCNVVWTRLAKTRWRDFPKKCRDLTSPMLKLHKETELNQN